MRKRIILCSALATVAAPPALADGAAPPAPPVYEAGRLTVRAAPSHDGSDLGGREGILRYTTIRSAHKVIARRTHGSGVVFNRRVRPGRYRITKWVRSCVGTCDLLDPPARKCTRTFTVRAGQRTTVTIPNDHDYYCPTTRPRPADYLDPKPSPTPD